ncbi:MAG: hypothetical protein MI919_14435, partial [Holophagales bacterium]|nr:hypothetical protein [Holophagales bacterium]
GTRIVACALLGSETGKATTRALLQVLAKDPSPAVRMQALRSLCAPGRSLGREQIFAATADEPEQRVLRLRAELIGGE